VKIIIPLHLVSQITLVEQYLHFYIRPGGSETSGQTGDPHEDAKGGNSVRCKASASQVADVECAHIVAKNFLHRQAVTFLKRTLRALFQEAVPMRRSPHKGGSTEGCCEMIHWGGSASYPQYF
jgi:hypothetical protein